MTQEKKIRTLIVDDEKYARRDLLELLSAFPSVEIIGEAKNIKSAVDIIDRLNPDLIFLDIQFPGETGFDVFEKTNIEAKVVFVTAYNEFAIRAFEVNACDYLLKPVHPERLALTISRLAEEQDPSVKKRNSFLPDDFIFMQVNYSYHFVKVSSIISITAADHYTEVSTAKGLKGLTNRSLKEWSECLPKDLFLQVHRSTIVNLNFVEKIERDTGYAHHLTIKNGGGTIPISRRFASLIKKKSD